MLNVSHFCLLAFYHSTYFGISVVTTHLDTNCARSHLVSVNNALCSFAVFTQVLSEIVESRHSTVYTVQAKITQC